MINQSLRFSIVTYITHIFVIFLILSAPFILNDSNLD